MELFCPISAEKVNENVVRLMAFMVAMVLISCIIAANYWAVVFLLFDFASRAFSSGKFSLLKVAAFKIGQMLSLSKKMTDLAPKKFAAALGFVFCLLITAVSFLNFSVLAMALTGIMTVFALLESLFAVCVGCYVYSFIQVLKRSKA